MFMLKSTHEKKMKALEALYRCDYHLMVDMRERLYKLGHFDTPIKNSKGLWINPTTGQFVKAPK